MRLPISALMVIATGLGKTYLSIFAIEHYLTPKDTVLFLVNSAFVRNQAYQRYVSYLADGERYSEDAFLNADPSNVTTVHADKRFIFCLFQSLHVLPDWLLQKTTILVIDEVHHVLAPTYLQKLLLFDNLKLKLGLTATLTH